MKDDFKPDMLPIAQVDFRCGHQMFCVLGKEDRHTIMNKELFSNYPGTGISNRCSSSSKAKGSLGACGQEIKTTEEAVVVTGRCL